MKLEKVLWRILYLRDTYVNNKPVIGGLFDPRMGVLEPGSYLSY